MGITSSTGTRIAGITATVPSGKVSNREYGNLSDQERDLMIKTIGIEHRRIADPGQSASDLCFVAAEKLIDELNWQKSDIDILVFVTQTPDYITPATSILLQDRLGLPHSCLAFDINLGCSGYIYGISVVNGLLNQFNSGKALLLVGDVSSYCVSEQDKSAAPIFGDAGSATAIEKTGRQDDRMTFNLQSDGSGYDHIMIKDGGMRHPVTEESLKYKEYDKNVSRNDLHLILNGIDVFNFSIRELPGNITRLLDEVSITSDQVDYFIFHQANKLINDTVRKKLQLPEEKVPSTLQEFGNTSSATIPLTIVHALADIVREQETRMIMSGFGVGLSWGSALVKTDGFVCPPIIET